MNAISPGRLVSCLDDLIMWERADFPGKEIKKENEWPEEKKFSLSEKIGNIIENFFYNVFFSAIDELDFDGIDNPRLFKGERALVLEVHECSAKISKLDGTIGWVEKGKLLIIC